MIAINCMTTVHKLHLYILYTSRRRNVCYSYGMEETSWFAKRVWKTAEEGKEAVRFSWWLFTSVEIPEISLISTFRDST